jgi:hypothetical protein
MNVAGCGGLFRDSDGQWLKGYTQRISDCDALYAEMWEMYTRSRECKWRKDKGMHIS